MIKHIEIELNNTITVKRLKIPINLLYSHDKLEYIRNYFIGLGYEVGEYIRIC